MRRNALGFSTLFKLAIAAMLACCVGSNAVTLGEEPEIHVVAGAEEIFLGESLDFQVEIRNSDKPSAPDLSAIKQEFEVVPNGEESRNQTSLITINGKFSKQEILSHVYQYQLTPKQAGKLKIPAATATVDGKLLTSRTLPLRVVVPEKQDLVIVELESSRQHVYPTQPFSVTLRVLVRPLPNSVDRDPLTPLRASPPHLQINWADPPKGLAAENKIHWLQPLLADDGVGFTLNDVSAQTGSFFGGSRAAVFKLSKGREIRDGLDGDPVRYFVYELSRTLTPERTGTFVMGPAVVKGTFVSNFERGEYRGQRLVTISSSEPIEVLDIPATRPATYCGGIGEYRATASASPTKLRVGDPLTLTVELERGRQSGSLELVSAPDLSAIPEIASNFDLIDKNPTGRVDGDKKRFAFALRPKHPDISIPALSLSTFDPESEKFVSIETSPIPLDVSQAMTLTGGDLVGSKADAPTISIKTKAQGIFQNITDPAEARDQRISLSSWIVAACAVWFVTGVLLGIFRVYRSKTSDVVWVRRQQARRTANRRVETASTRLAEGKSVEALREIRSAVVGLVADTTNRIAEGLTSSDIEAALKSASVPDADRMAMSRLLRMIESAEYGASSTEVAADAIEESKRLISSITPALERGSSK